MNLNFTPIKLHLLTGMACMLAMSITSCNKDSSSSSTTASIAVVAGSPDMPPTDLYLNGDLFGSNLVYGSYVSYVTISGGTVKVGLDYTGTTTHLTGDTVSLGANKAYSLFSADLVAKHDHLLVTDTVVAPPSGKATIRLVNMSPNALGVDLVIGGQVIASNRSYKQVSSFKAIPTSDNDTLKIVQTGTTNVLGVVSAVTVQSGVVYTIWLGGFANNLNGYGLNAYLMRNAAF